LWPSNEEALAIHQRIATGFSADYGAFGALWPSMTAHLDDDGKDLMLTKMAIIHTGMMKIAKARTHTED
jgi:hypothetical protein